MNKNHLDPILEELLREQSTTLALIEQYKRGKAINASDCSARDFIVKASERVKAISEQIRNYGNRI